MRIRNRGRGALLSLPLLLVLVSLTGCFKLSRTEPPQRSYVLAGGVAANTAEPRAVLADLSLGIRRLELADYLATPFVTVRRGPNAIVISEYDRWAEDLDGGFSRAIAQNLSARERFLAVDVAPWAAQSRYDYLLRLNLLRFEGVAADSATVGEARMLVSWEILSQLNGSVVGRGTTDFRGPGWAVGDLPGLVALLDAGVDQLGSDLVNSLEDLVSASASVVSGGDAVPRN